MKPLELYEHLLALNKKIKKVFKKNISEPFWSLESFEVSGVTLKAKLFAYESLRPDASFESTFKKVDENFEISGVRVYYNLTAKVKELNPATINRVCRAVRAKDPTILKEIETPKEWQKSLLVVIPGGLFMWFPYIDRRKEFEELEQEFYETKFGQESWKHNYEIIFSSPLHQKIIYYTGETNAPTAEVKTIRGACPHYGIEELYHFFFNNDVKTRFSNLLEIAHLKTSVVYDYEEAEALLAQLEFRKSEPVKRLIAYGCAQVIIKWRNKLDEIKAKYEEIKKKREEIRKCPPLPHFRHSTRLFPHQNHILGRLATERTAIVGVEMGGGKTLMSIYDSLLQVKLGRVKRPAIVLPNNLIPQFKDEIYDFTGGTVNTIVINSVTWNRYGPELLSKMLKVAPKNTIVLVSYDWIAQDEERGTWLVANGIDMITFDEAHFIKNIGSARSKAAMALSLCKVKRVMSGTIATNKLFDLVVPTMITKPFLFESPDEFKERYMEKTPGGRAVGYRPGALDEIKEKVNETGATFISRAAWIYLLPSRKIKIHRAVASSTLMAEYSRILENTLAELQKDERAMAILNELEGDLSQYPLILQKLSILDSLLAAPGAHSEVIAQLEKDDPETFVGPKIKKLNEILKAHFSDPNAGKVIVMCKKKLTAQFVLKHIWKPEGAKALYFDAENKANLLEFKNNSDVKILVAVDHKLKEGWNITEATRVVRMEMNWNWADEDQAFGRIFRFGQTKPVYLDIILVDNTIDVTKFINLVTKHITNSAVLTDWGQQYLKVEGKFLEFVRMNVRNIKEVNKFNDALPYVEFLNQALEFERKYGEQHYKKIFGEELIDPGTAEPLAAVRIPVPYIKGFQSEDWYIVKKGSKFVTYPPNWKSIKNKINKVFMTEISKNADLVPVEELDPSLGEKISKPVSIDQSRVLRTADFTPIGSDRSIYGYAIVDKNENPVLFIDTSQKKVYLADEVDKYSLIGIESVRTSKKVFQEMGPQIKDAISRLKTSKEMHLAIDRQGCLYEVEKVFKTGPKHIAIRDFAWIADIKGEDPRRLLKELLEMPEDDYWFITNRARLYVLTKKRPKVFTLKFEKKRIKCTLTRRRERQLPQTQLIHTLDRWLNPPEITL